MSSDSKQRDPASKTIAAIFMPDPNSSVSKRIVRGVGIEETLCVPEERI